MMRRRGLRLPLPRRAEPELTPDELDWLLGAALDSVQASEHAMARTKVSESVIRSKWTGDVVSRKLRAAGAIDPHLRTPEDRANFEVSRRRR